MLSNKINVLMISYGSKSFYENRFGVLDRHIKYASHFNSLTIFLLTKDKTITRFENLNLSIIPVYGKSYIISFFKLLFKGGINNYNIVTTQDPFITGLTGVFYKKIYGIKLHIQNHSSFIDNKYWIKENFLVNSIFNLLAKKITLKSADRLRVVNSKEKLKYIDKLKIKESIIDIAPIGVHDKIDCNSQDILKFKNFHKLPKDKFIIGWAGRFVKLKRLNLIFEAISKSNCKEEIVLLLAGDHLKSEYNLDSLSVESNIKVIYTGVLEKSEMPLFYNSLDLYVQSSLYEGYGVVIKEAISYKIPVLSTKNAGSIDQIKDGENGYLFDTLNQLKSLIEMLFKDRDHLIYLTKFKLIEVDNENDIISSLVKS
jgi:glycosyltransferase involved in cell wall biosynthesis